MPIALEIIDARTFGLKELIEFREREEKETSCGMRDLRHRYIAGLEKYVARLTTHKENESDAEEIKRQFVDDMRTDLEGLKQELRYAGGAALLSKEILVTVLAVVGSVAAASGLSLPILGTDPPPLKWSDSKYGFLPEEDCNAKEETQA